MSRRNEASARAARAERRNKYEETRVSFAVRWLLDERKKERVQETPAREPRDDDPIWYLRPVDAVVVGRFIRAMPDRDPADDAVPISETGRDADTRIAVFYAMRRMQAMTLEQSLIHTLVGLLRPPIGAKAKP